MESITKGDFNTATDVWSYGVLLWEMLTMGMDPYRELGNDIRALMTFIGEDKNGRLKAPDCVSNPVAQKITDCWNLNPDERPIFSDLFKFFFNEVLSTNLLRLFSYILF